MTRDQIRYVHVVYKTHLDVGYTALAQDVLDQYVEDFIPKALDTAERAGGTGTRPFVWTTGSYLIDYFLRHAKPMQAARMCAAIERGDIAWHALAFTTCTELMDSDLLEYDLSISRSLDKRFGRKTIAAKMTDVPGHTKAMLLALAKAGVRYLHLGINGASRPVQVPPLCRWRHGGAEIILNYAADYGEEALYDGCAHALVFAHSRDNMGPPTVEEAESTILQYQKAFPNAEVFGSTLDAFAQALLDSGTDRMPVVTSEMGDSWIYGVGTDPWKVGAYRALLRLKDEWKAAGIWGADQRGYHDFMENLLLVAEHTWGMDLKKYLYDYKNWGKSDFICARANDVTDEAAFLEADPVVARGILEEHRKYTAGRHVGSYSLFERSQEEQRMYLRKAAAALPVSLRTAAEKEIAALKPVEKPAGPPLAWSSGLLPLGGWQVKIGEDGSIETVKFPDGRGVTGAAIAAFTYEIFDAQTVSECYAAYNRQDEAHGGWARSDFGKPGLEAVPGLHTQRWRPSVYAVERSGRDGLRVLAELPQAACEEYGGPRRLEIVYEARRDGLDIRLSWFDKPASRIPEAIWAGFRLPGLKREKSAVSIMGEVIDPWDVIPGGNRKLHCVERVLYAGRPLLESLDAPLVCLGGRHLYDEDDRYPNWEDGVSCQLYNNRWGTNCKMWYEEDAVFRFVLKLPEDALNQQGEEER